MAMQILGLDIGGAHLKAAHSSGEARTVAFPLWKQPAQLPAECSSLCASMPTYERLAVTMTGELCDCFESLREGVVAILAAVRSVAGDTPVQVWRRPGEFVDLESARSAPHHVGAANWLALAKLIARRFAGERVLLIDTGSTTTDIVYLNRGQPEPLGL